VLDDLGAEVIKKDENGESWALQKLFEIVDARQGKHTIYTTNLNEEKLLIKYNPRNISRIMFQTDTVRLEGQDHRLKREEA
jgi:DNA replication protein DnaC